MARPSPAKPRPAILFSRAGNLPGIEPGIGIAAVATLGYLGFLAGPPVIGLIAEVMTLRVALGLVVVCCALLALHAGAAGVEEAERMPATAAFTPPAPTERRAS